MDAMQDTLPLYASRFSADLYEPGHMLYPYDTSFNKFLAEHLNTMSLGDSAVRPLTKLVIWDWDDTSGPLYPVADITAYKAFLDLANIMDTDYGHMASVARTIPGEYICHEPRNLLVAMAASAEATDGMARQLGPIDSDQAFKNKRVEAIVREWEQNRRVMFNKKNDVFASVPDTMKALRAGGAYNVIVTSSMPGSLKRRMFETFGGVNAQDFMAENISAVLCRNSIPGIEESIHSYQGLDRPAEEERAEINFRKFLDRTLKTGTTAYGDSIRYFTGVKENQIKGAQGGQNILLRALAIANAVTGENIQPEETIKIGDTGSDYKAAHAVGMRLYLTTEGTVVNSTLIGLHRNMGCQKKELDASQLVGDVKDGSIRPHQVIARASDVLNLISTPK